MAIIIAENSYLIPDSKKHAHVENNKYLLLANDIEEEIADPGDEINAKLDDLKHKIEVHVD